MAVLMVGCDKAEEDSDKFYHIDLQITGLSPVSTGDTEYDLIYDVPQEGATIHVEAVGEHKDDAYVQMVDVNGERIYFRPPYQSYFSEEVSIVYPTIGIAPKFDIVIPPNMTTETREVSVSFHPLCLNQINIIQPGLSAEE